jgi:hypothetical protein
MTQNIESIVVGDNAYDNVKQIKFNRSDASVRWTYAIGYTDTLNVQSCTQKCDPHDGKFIEFKGMWTEARGGGFVNQPKSTTVNIFLGENEFWKNVNFMKIIKHIKTRNAKRLEELEMQRKDEGVFQKIGNFPELPEFVRPPLIRDSSKGCKVSGLGSPEGKSPKLPDLPDFRRLANTDTALGLSGLMPVMAIILMLLVILYAFFARMTTAAKPTGRHPVYRKFVQKKAPTRIYRQ